VLEPGDCEKASALGLSKTTSAQPHATRRVDSLIR